MTSLTYHTPAINEKKKHQTHHHPGSIVSLASPPANIHAPREVSSSPKRAWERRPVQPRSSGLYLFERTRSRRRPLDLRRVACVQWLTDKLFILGARGSLSADSSLFSSPSGLESRRPWGGVILRLIEGCWVSGVIVVGGSISGCSFSISRKICRLLSISVKARTRVEGQSARLFKK